jgi:hypothetical protein
MFVKWVFLYVLVNLLFVNLLVAKSLIARSKEQAGARVDVVGGDDCS